LREEEKMKNKLLGIFVCMLVIITVLPISALAAHRPLESKVEAIGVKESYKSVVDIPSPDNQSYPCIMFCENHEQVLKWISLINESGFEKAWQKKFLELTIFFILPGTKIIFGLLEFRIWYSELFYKLKHKNEFLNFLNTYDTVNGSGMITYLWLSGKINRPVDFKAQPDNSWIENSWVIDDGGEYIPNPEIWGKLYFWYFTIPF
jgi:hypothetical protein